MMDFSEQSPLSHIPASSLSMRLVRPPIKMDHTSDWQVDKINPTHDLIICLSGGGDYTLDNDPTPIHIRPGQAMLVPATTRFKGVHYGGDERLIGLAQHFTLTLFDNDDFISKLDLHRSVSLKAWPSLAPLIHQYRGVALLSGTNLIQHHQFMVFLLAYLEDAFIDWKAEKETPDAQDQLSVQIMRMVSRLSVDLLGVGTDEILKHVPYNPDYFRRAFKDRMGVTPHKFRERKRMEFAVSRLSLGLSVKAVAAELGYSDPYFFSRMFKRYLGDSPSAFKPGAEKGP